jgi:hypothetical protein
MPLDLQDLRQQLLREIQAARDAGAGAYLHLLYTPELHDPLGLLGETRRVSAPIRPSVALKVVSARPDRTPRLLTLDCRRVAAYLLETDPALDDPAFEASVTQTHAEICGAQARDKLPRNDESELSEFSVAGWFVTADDAATMAARLKDFSVQQRGWVSWTRPAFIHALWPTMDDAQRSAMLGGATWLALSPDGQLQRYCARPRHVTGNAMSTPATADASLSAKQLRMVNNVQLVRDLMTGWDTMRQSEGLALPSHAEQILHAHVMRAQDHGLDSDSVAIYAMTIVQLKEGAHADAEWESMMRAVAEQGIVLRDCLAELSDAFWERYVPAASPLY